MAGRFIDITVRDGTIIPAYVTQPAKGSGPGIVLLHDAHGLDDFVSIGGVQVGHDIYADATPTGHRNHYGFFLGFALGFPNSDVGHLSINADSAGLH
ncbi:hypothetical protein [Caballeronia sp. J97]|uniref:hypothetical protein n=1 Tax=Caballeronia sp. J97 TaxID=2805429 RepID=UPI002AAF1872|nr:hypothetical protein [Caballeronia sp. J97]